MHRTASKSPVIVGLVAVFYCVVAASPAIANDNSKNDPNSNCIMYAYDPVVHTADNTATARGEVDCGTRHTISLTVSLQYMKAGKWYTANNGKAVSDVSMRDTATLFTDVTSACGRGDMPYRSKTVASVDNRKSVAVASVSPFPFCGAAP